jgi:capsular exopolysaccharide synthesis family protein
VELRDFLRTVRKGWPLIVAFVVLGTALGIGATLATKKVYEATVEVFVATSAGTTATDLANGNTFSQDRVQSYTSIAKAPDVTGAVIDKLGLTLTGEQLANKITADAPQNKVLIDLHVTDNDPQQAATLANAVAQQFDSVVQRTEQTDATGKPLVKLTVIHPATVPTSPIKPSKTINIGLGFVLGLLVGIGFVVLRDVLDNTVKGPQDFAELGVPVLGYIPFDKRTAQSVIAFRSDPHSARSEAYRQLRTNLQFVNVDDSPRVIAITSAIPGEGKTTTAVNLASALAEGGYRVCLVEADLRRPTLAKALGLVGDVGFTTVLIGKAPLEAVLQNAGRNLAVLTSGEVPPNPTELLMSVHANTIIRQIARQVDYVIIDSAPLLPVADGAEVAALSDATLVVHHAGKSTREQAARSIEALGKVGTRPVGIVLNMITRGRGRYDDEYGYYYAAYRPDRSHARQPDRETATSNAEKPSETPAARDTSASSTRGAPGFQYSQPAQYGAQAEESSSYTPGSGVPGS